MIGQVYPRAAGLLGEAFDALDRVRRRWEGHVEGDPSDIVITTDQDGAGRIMVFPSWQPGDREALTSELRVVVETLWACLDSLIIETVEMFSARERDPRPDRKRFFPIADSDDGLEALLEESCLHGVPTTHVQIVRDCQPFRASPDHPVPVMLRTALRNLLEWDNHLQCGELVDAWVTPASPAVWTEPPGAVVELKKAEPGPADDGRVMARYKIAHPQNCSVAGQAGSYADFCLPSGFAPENDEDTFDRRLTAAVTAVVRLAALFSRETAAVRGVRAMTRAESGNPPVETWTPAAHSRRAWSNDELAELATGSEIGLGIVPSADELMLLVTTEDGVYERVVPTASSLNPSIEQGKAAEDAAHSAAATWGLPDFVFLPSAEHRGSKNREISDGLIVTGDRGIVLQVKSRTAATGPDREAAWVDKKVEQAVRQVEGTVRRLRDHPAEMINGRGRNVTLVGADIEWVGVVLLDHPDPPYGHTVAGTTKQTPIVTLLRRDWEFLFAQLRSTRAVVDYLHRVVGNSRLGAEPERYFELAKADEVAEPTRIVVRGLGDHRSVPQLPTAPAGSDDDQAHGMVRIMCEDIATSPHSDNELERLRVLATIDSLPIGYRTELGRLLIDALAEVRRTPDDQVRWKFRTFRAELGQPALGFGVCSRLDEVTGDAFRSWVLLRHFERAEHPDDLADSLSLGVLLTPRRDGLRDWDTTLFAIQGDPGLSAEQLASWRRVWNSAEGGQGAEGEARMPASSVDGDKLARLKPHPHRRGR